MKVCRHKCKSKKEKIARAKVVEQKRKAILESRQRQKVYPIETVTYSKTERSQEALENVPRSKSDSLLRLQSVRVEHGANSSEYLNALKQEGVSNHIDSEVECKGVKQKTAQSVTEQTKIAAKPQSVTEQTKIAAKPQSVTEQTKIAVDSSKTPGKTRR